MTAIQKPSTPAGARAVIGSTIVIQGEVSGDEDLVIRGTVRGRVSLTRSLFVLASGVVEADLATASIDVSGRVTGNIAARDKVELMANCNVAGDIQSPRVVIADGAAFNGTIDMDVNAEGR
jgi:cytoskeletal protein CcmA (bactofilin family)